MDVRPGLTILVGENDAGKTAVVDALRFALGTTDLERIWLADGDFHGTTREMRIVCKFDHLTPGDLRAFLEYLTYGAVPGAPPSLYVNWTATDTGTIYRGHPYRRV